MPWAGFIFQDFGLTRRLLNSSSIESSLVVGILGRYLSQPNSHSLWINPSMSCHGIDHVLSATAFRWSEAVASVRSCACARRVVRDLPLR